MRTESIQLPASTRSSDPPRLAWFTLALFVVGVVGDGWSGRPSGLAHQLLVLPFTGVFAFAVIRLLFTPGQGSLLRLRWALILGLAFEAAFLLLFVYEARHFAFLGYRFHAVLAGGVFAYCIGVLGFTLRKRQAAVIPSFLLGAAAASYAAGMLLSIYSFPLNYLRSDMLPVTLWADTNLLHGISPYVTMHVGSRLYDYPYLPGVLIAYLPAVAAHLDVRFISLLALLEMALQIFHAARPERRREVAAILSLFLLDPFLQYRHDLYLEPHWLLLTLAVLLMQRGRHVWGSFVLGLSMGVYQFSWIVLPFVLLYGLRRRGWSEVAKLAAAAIAGMLLLVGPFLGSAGARISSNSVGQWGQFSHALADPMNLSWWLTLLIPPGRLLWVQGCLMVVIFAWCYARGRCTTLADTLRWSIVALTVFVLCNSIVDGYFFLMLLVPMLLFVCIANGWFREPADAVHLRTQRALA